MTRAEARDAMRSFGEVHSSPGGLDYFFPDNSFQIEYIGGTVDFIGVSCSEYCQYVYRNIDPFDLPAPDFFRLAAGHESLRHTFDENEYVFPDQILTVYEADEQYDCVRGYLRPVYGQIGLGNRAYLELVQHTEQIRSANEVARRCVVLYAVLAAGHREPRDQLVAWLRREGLWDALSPEESEFLVSVSPTEPQRIQATWRAEALFPLLWSLGLIPQLPSPQQLCDVQLMRDVLPPLFGSVAEFISSARLRDDAEIHAANEEICEIHWRVRDFQLSHEPTPPGKLPRMPHEHFNPPADSYDSGVVQERHHALNWLISYWGQDWDDITTDT